VAYADPLLSAAGLQGDRIGDAAAFFGLSHGQLHLLVCACHHGGTVEPSAAAEYVRALARVAATPARTALVTGFAVSMGLATILAFVTLF
jgi:hypothetical protein